MFCDVDKKKLSKGVYIYEEAEVRVHVSRYLIFDQHTNKSCTCPSHINCAVL